MIITSQNKLHKSLADYAKYKNIGLVYEIPENKDETAFIYFFDLNNQSNEQSLEFEYNERLCDAYELNQAFSFRENVADWLRLETLNNIPYHLTCRNDVKKVIDFIASELKAD